MASNVSINDKGFRDMIKALKKKTGMSYRDVVRGVSAQVLAGTARKTKAAPDDAAQKRIQRMFRKPVELPNGAGYVGVTKANKVWFSGTNFGSKKKWILLNSAGKLQNPGGRLTATSKKRSSFDRSVSPAMKAQIERAVADARRLAASQFKYLRRTAGLGRASWLEMMRMARMPIPGGGKLNKAKAIVIPRAVKNALRINERNDGGGKFSIVGKTTVAAALNKNAKGLSAFRQSLNGQVRTFERNILKDFDKYARRFAKRNGVKLKP